MLTRSSISLLAGLLLVGCGEAQAPTPQDVETGQAEGLPPTADPPQPPPVVGGEIPVAPNAAPTVLQPIVRADWSDRLESGAGCNLSVDGRDYVVVVVGDGVARIGGYVVDLTGVPETYNAMAEGGRFAGGGATVEIVPSAGPGEDVGGGTTFTLPAQVTVTSGGTTERFDADWICGG